MDVQQVLFLRIAIRFSQRYRRCQKYTDLPSSATSYVNVHTKNSKEYHKHLIIAHLNIQSMTSTFDEFHVVIHENQFDIVTLSETWLRDKKDLLDYAKIPGYNFVYENKEQMVVE